MSDQEESGGVRTRMQQAGIMHGETVRADLPGVLIRDPRTLTVRGTLAIRFHGIGYIDNVRTITASPKRRRIVNEPLKLKGTSRLLKLRPGIYDLQGVVIYSHDCITLHIDDQTQIVWKGVWKPEALLAAKLVAA